MRISISCGVCNLHFLVKQYHYYPVFSSIGIAWMSCGDCLISIESAGLMIPQNTRCLPIQVQDVQLLTDVPRFPRKKLPIGLM